MINNEGELLSASIYYVLSAMEHGYRKELDIISYVHDNTFDHIQLGPATYYTLINSLAEMGYIMRLNQEDQIYSLTANGMDSLNNTRMWRKNLQYGKEDPVYQDQEHVIARQEKREGGILNNLKIKNDEPEVVYEAASDGSRENLIRRLIECPYYDVSGMESWLTCMASNGLVLSHDGFLGVTTTFILSKPCRMRYRLITSYNDHSCFSSKHPDHNEIQTYKHFGWDYICRRGHFYIFATTKEEAVEPHTNKTLHAESIEKAIALENYGIDGFLAVSLTIAAMCFCDYEVIKRLHPALLVVLIFLLLAKLLIIISRKMWLTSYLKKVKSGQALMYQESWKKNRSGYFILRSLWILSVVCVIIAFIVDFF